MLPLTDEIIQEIESLSNKGAFNWSWLSHNVELTQEFATKYQTRLDWGVMAGVQDFPFDFWMSMLKRVSGSYLYSIGRNKHTTFEKIVDMFDNSSSILKTTKSQYIAVHIICQFIQVNRLSENQILAILSELKPSEVYATHHITKAICKYQTFSLEFFIKHKDIMDHSTVITRRMFKMTKHTKTMFIMYGIGNVV